MEICLSRASDSSLFELARIARRLKFLKGEYIFNDGDASEYFYLVESGRVILSKDASSGKAFTFLIATRGLPLNAVACFKPRPRFFSARAVEKTMVIAIPSPAFKQWVLENADVAACILDTMGNLLDGAYTRILDLIDESAEQRILNALNMLSLRIGPDLPMTNNDIADMTGTSRETAARVISRLQEAGLIRKSRGHIEILNGLQLDGLSTSPIFIL
jgi:CRP-like cAMP-binding protein